MDAVLPAQQAVNDCLHMCWLCIDVCTAAPAPLQEVAQLEAETQEIYLENQQLNKQQTALNAEASLPPMWCHEGRSCIAAVQTAVPIC